MTKITDRYEEAGDSPLFVCDFSPPRGAGPELLEPAARIDADWISVAYNPGRSTRVSPPIAAHWIKEHTGRDVVFTLATRDMNKIAVQSLLLGAQLMGLENVVVVQGDRLTERDLSRVRDRERLPAHGAAGSDQGDEPGHRLQGPEAAVAYGLLRRRVHRPRQGHREGGPAYQAQGGGGGRNSSCRSPSSTRHRAWSF